MDIKHLFKPYHLLLYFLAVAVFFVLGASMANASGATEGQGLAGGAIVLIYGIYSAFVALVFFMFLAYYAKESVVHRSLQGMIVLFVVILIWIVFRLVAAP